MTALIDIILHLDVHLVQWVTFFGPWIYVIMFLVIFCETGLVVTPFLPGDSLLFALGALCAMDGGLSLGILLLALTIAAILGNVSNYQIGRYLGPKVLQSNGRILKKKYLDQAQAFYDKWGGFTIVASRFAPIVRTFAPFVAGVGHMSYKKFLSYNVIGGIAWVFTFTLAGYFFGNLPSVKSNFHIVIFAVIAISLIPMVWPWISSKLKKA